MSGFTINQANPGYEPKDQADLLHAAGVSVFAIGIGSIDVFELRDMATDPSYVFTLSSFDKLFDLVGQMRAITCDEGTRINPGTGVDSSVDKGALRYFTPSCGVLPSTLTLRIEDTKGRSRVFVATTPNPGPLNFQWKNESNATIKIMTIERGSSPIYVAIQGLDTVSQFNLTLDGTFLAGNAAQVGSWMEGEGEEKERRGRKLTLILGVDADLALRLTRQRLPRTARRRWRWRRP